MEGHCLLLPVPHDLLSLSSYSTPDHPPRGDITHSELGPLISIINQENPSWLAHRSVWWGHFLNRSSLFQNDSSLCQTDIKLDSTNTLGWFTVERIMQPGKKRLRNYLSKYKHPLDRRDLKSWLCNLWPPFGIHTLMAMPVTLSPFCWGIAADGWVYRTQMSHPWSALLLQANSCAWDEHVTKKLSSALKVQHKQGCGLSAEPVRSFFIEFGKGSSSRRQFM